MAKGGGRLVIEDDCCGWDHRGAWLFLYDGGAWTDLGHGLTQGGTFHFKARLHPIVNDNKPGIYRVIKQIGFNSSPQKWYMTAEFSIE